MQRAVQPPSQSRLIQFGNGPQNRRTKVTRADLRVGRGAIPLSPMHATAPADGGFGVLPWEPVPLFLIIVAIVLGGALAVAGIAVARMRREPGSSGGAGFRVLVPGRPRWGWRGAAEAWGWMAGVGFVVGGVWWMAEWSVARRGPGPEARSTVERAQALFDAGDHRGALEVYSGAIGRDPGAAAALLGRGRCRLKIKDFAGALDDAIRARDLGANAGETSLLIARAKTCLGSYGEALLEFDMALAAGVDRQEVLLLRGALQDELGHPDAACRDFDELIRLNPLEWMAFLMRGQVRLGQGRFDLALQDYGVLPKSVSELPAVQVGRGVAMLGLRRWGEALECFERAIGAGGTQPGAWRGKAAALEALGQDAEAAGAWERTGGRPPEGETPVPERGLGPGDAAFFLRGIRQPVAGQAAVRVGESTGTAAAR